MGAQAHVSVEEEAPAQAVLVVHAALDDLVPGHCVCQLAAAVGPGGGLSIDLSKVGGAVSRDWGCRLGLCSLWQWFLGLDDLVLVGLGSGWVFFATHYRRYRI